MARTPEQPHEEPTAAEIIGLLQRGCCASVSTETIESLILGGRVRQFPAGQAVYAEAEPEALAVVVEGLLRVYMHASDGRQVTVRYVRTGGLLGAPALVAGPAPVFVQAIASSAVYFFEIDHVRRIARTHPPVAWAFAEESVHRLYDVLEELAGNAFASVRQRVARHLLDLAASQPGAGSRLTAFVNQQDLANSVGSVREVVARILAEFRAERLVRTSPGRVELLDPIQMSRQLWSRARDQSHST